MFPNRIVRLYVVHLGVSSRVSSGQTADSSAVNNTSALKSVEPPAIPPPANKQNILVGNEINILHNLSLEKNG